MQYNDLTEQELLKIRSGLLHFRDHFTGCIDFDDMIILLIFSHGMITLEIHVRGNGRLDFPVTFKGSPIESSCNHMSTSKPSAELLAGRKIEEYVQWIVTSIRIVRAQEANKLMAILTD